MVRVFNHCIHKQKLYQIMFDMALVILIVVLSFVYQSATPLTASPQVLLGAVLMGTGMSAINTSLGIYTASEGLSAAQLRWRALVALCLSLPLAYLVFHLAPPADRTIFGLALLAAMVLMLLYRTSVASSLTRRAAQSRVLIYGTGLKAQKVGQLLKAVDPHVTLVGYYASPMQGQSVLEKLEAQPNLFSPGVSLADLVQREKVEEVVVALGERRSAKLQLRELLDCKLQGVRVMDVATHFEQTLGQIRRDLMSAGWLVCGDGFEQSPWRAAVKRMFDLVCASLLLVLALPVMLLAALLIVLETGRPILYWQERVGLRGKTFRMLKFRSMRTDAEKDGIPRWASKADDRVTRVGRYIRRHRIDELPQLFNVLAGDMSLVGPRPERPGFVNTLNEKLPYYAVRHSVKPGITGWAQVRFPYGASIDDASEKLQYDMYYVKNQCLLLDLIILFDTVGVVLTCKGAH